MAPKSKKIILKTKHNIVRLIHPLKISEILMLIHHFHTTINFLEGDVEY